MPSHRISFYSRLKPEDELPQHRHPTREPLQHNLDVRKLQRRCCYCLSAALFIAIVLWFFDPPAGHETVRGPENTNTQLKFVVVVHRHGARSSLHSFDFEEDIRWSVPHGKLLDIGFKGGFELGRKLRNAYWNQLTSLFDSSVESISTNMDRTVDTAHSVLLGLFTDNTTQLTEGNCTCRPPDKSRTDAECAAQCIGVKFTPLPNVTVLDEKHGNEERILRQNDYCNAFREHRDRVFESDVYKNASKDLFADEFDYVQKIIGTSQVCTKEANAGCTDLTVFNISRIWDSVQCLSAQQGIENGPYTNTQETYERLLSVQTWLAHQLYSYEIGPDVGGLLLNRIITNLTEGAKRWPQASLRRESFSSNEGSLMTLYSAHDSTLEGLLAAMGVSDWHFPAFASYMTFELYGPIDPTGKTTLDDHNVRISFDGE